MNKLYGDLNMTKVMFGQNAVHVPTWMVVQNQGESGVMIAGASQQSDMLFGTDKTHCMILGEIIVRPHFVIASDDFKGHGIGGFWTHLPSAQEWFENGDLLVSTNHGAEAFNRWK